MAARSADNCRRPLLESLEPRCCPAVLLEFEAGVLRLTGDEGNNVVEIRQRRDGALDVLADGERQSFAGVEAIFASLGDGDDTLRSSKPKEIVVVGSKIKEDYDLGEGDDTLLLADRGGDVENKINMAGGNDSIWIDIGAPVRVSPAGDLRAARLVIDLGDGNDSVQARLQDAGDVQLGLRAGAGDDAVAVRANDRLRSAGPITGWPSMETDIDLAAGNDRLLVETNGYGDVNSFVDAGDGDDEVQVRHRMFALVDRTNLQATMLLGAGHDRLAMEAMNYLRVGANIDLGVGDDRFDGKYLITGVTHRYSHEDSSLGFAATLGAGRDIFKLHAAGYDEVSARVQTGPPGDRDAMDVKFARRPALGQIHRIDHAFDDGEDSLSLLAAGYARVSLIPSPGDARDLSITASL